MPVSTERKTSLFIVGASVIGTLLSACDWQRPGSAEQLLVKPPPDSAPQLAFGATLTLTHEGVVKARLRADSAYVYGEGLRMELRGVRMAFVDTGGDSISTATAKQGRYDVKQSLLEISGSVSVVSSTGKTLQTARAFFDPETNTLRGDSSYTLSEQAPARQSSGTSFELAPALTKVVRPRPK